jgi:isocitrate/isopropylmalate dehydrogenase
MRFLLLPGDGIGPEISDVVRQVLNALAARFDLDIKINDVTWGFLH